MSTPGETALVELAAELREEESVISAHVREPDAVPYLGILAGSGPATVDRGSSYALIVECVREGYLLHYGSARLIDPPDEDLALLAGDYLYAKGLERLAALGDLGSVRELSDLISLSAQLHAGGSEEAAERVPVLWLASTIAIAAGAGPTHEKAKQLIRDGGSADALYASAAEAAAEAGLNMHLAKAAEAVGFPPSHRG